MALKMTDLTDLERLYLAVVAVGLVPSKLAGDPQFRVDYITAVCWALSRDEAAESYLNGSGPDCSPEFARDLAGAMRALEEKGVIRIGAPPPGMGLLILDEPTRFATDWSSVDLDTMPQVVDRFLAHECLDALLNHHAVYSFIMDKYAESSEVWQKLTAAGYGDWPGP